MRGQSRVQCRGAGLRGTDDQEVRQRHGGSPLREYALVQALGALRARENYPDQFCRLWDAGLTVNARSPSLSGPGYVTLVTLTGIRDPGHPDETPPGLVARGAHGKQSARQRADHTSFQAPDDAGRNRQRDSHLIRRGIDTPQTLRWTS